MNRLRTLYPLLSNGVRAAIKLGENIELVRRRTGKALIGARDAAYKNMENQMDANPDGPPSGRPTRES